MKKILSVLLLSVSSLHAFADDIIFPDVEGYPTEGIETFENDSINKIEYYTLCNYNIEKCTKIQSIDQTTYDDILNSIKYMDDIEIKVSELNERREKTNQ